MNFVKIESYHNSIPSKTFLLVFSLEVTVKLILIFWVLSLFNKIFCNLTKAKAKNVNFFHLAYFLNCVL